MSPSVRPCSPTIVDLTSFSSAIFSFTFHLKSPGAEKSGGDSLFQASGHLYNSQSVSHTVPGDARPRCGPLQGYGCPDVSDEVADRTSKSALVVVLPVRPDAVHELDSECGAIQVAIEVE